jgi:hypothetical protein
MLQDRYGKELGEPELGFLLVCSSDFRFVHHDRAPAAAGKIETE